MSRFVLTGFADEIDQDLTVQLDVLAKLDINYIEMRGVNGKNLVEYPIKMVREIKEILDDRNVKLSAVGSPIGKIGIEDDFSSHLDLFKHTVEIAQVMDAPYIRMFSFYIPQDKEARHYRQAVIDRWGEFIDAARGSGITLLHENEKHIYGDTAERCLDLLTSLNCDYVKAIFDPANFIQCDEETYPYAWQLLQDYVVYMHIKDANYADHKVVPPGSGGGKLLEILTELNKREQKCFLSLEPHLNSYSGPIEFENDVNIPEGKPRLFALAWQELNKILARISV